MAIILTETYESLTNSELIRMAARQLGESETAVSAAISGAGMAILARLSQVSGDTQVMNRVAPLIEAPGVDGNAAVAGATTAASRLGRGTALLNIVYGPRLQGLVDALARYASISQPSARAAIGHAAPLVLKALGERLSEYDPGMSGLAPTPAQLADVLIRERDTITLDVPPALMAALDKPAVRITPQPVTTVVRPAVNPGSVASAAAAAADASRQGGPSTAAAREMQGSSIATSEAPARIATAQYEMDGASLSAPTLIGGLVAIAFLWWLFLPGLYAPYSLRVSPAIDGFSRSADQRGDSRANDRTSVSRAPVTGPDTQAGGTFSSSTSATPSSRTLPAPVTNLIRFIKRTLPSNKQIDFAEEGIEGRLIQLIENRSLPLDRNQWFDFDRLNFQTGSSNLTAESRAQVQNIADILASYPAVKIKIGGYTDNVGEPAANQRLAEARAQRVMMELITLGINALRLDAEGYGEQHPVADNSTSEGRARNRRIAVRVTER